MNIYPLKIRVLEDYLEQMLEASEGEITPEIQAVILEAAGSKEEWLNDIAAMLMNSITECAAIEAEISRLKKKCDKVRNRIGKLEDLLPQVLKHDEKWTNGILSMHWHKSTAVEINEAIAFPEKFTRTKTTVTPDKVKIRAALDAGEKIPGAMIVERFSLQVK